MAQANPFHLEAVATYGIPAQTCESLGYVTRARDELLGYLTSYADTSRRYGGAVGLRGEHGSGKTHLLNWLAQKAREMRRGAASVAYAKADSTNLLDLYKQAVAQVEREAFVHLVSEAKKALAAAEVGKAKVTSSLKGRIETASDLAPLFEERNLQADVIELLFEGALHDAGVPPELRRAFAGVSKPAVGARNYRWLLGDDVDNLEEIGQTHQLGQLGEATSRSADPDHTAALALGALAALHRLAGTPFVLLIDQLEVLLRAEAARQQTLFSVLKKVIEQVGRQYGFMFIAGSEEAWRKLPRDVPARLRQREALRVGDLTVPETEDFLAAYVGSVPGFALKAVETINELSGGSPREIVRIAYHAFERTRGDLPSANDEILLDSARESGSVEDRSLLALGMADRVLVAHGDVSKDLTVGKAQNIDRVLRDAGGPFLALVAVRATDKVSEVNLARRVATTKEFLEREWPGAELVVVAVGYASEEVHALLRQTASSFTFREATFEGELETLVSLAAARHRRKSQQRAAEPDPQVLSILQNISTRLEHLETRRVAEVKEVEQRFEAAATARSAAQTSERELKTRWEILDELDRLEGALDSHLSGAERDIVRGILVANEAYRSDPLLDQLGSLYVEALGGLYPSADDPGVEIRHGLLAEMRATLMGRGTWRKLMAAPVRSSALIGAGALTIAEVAWVGLRLARIGRLGGTLLDAIVLTLPLSVLAGLVAAAAAAFSIVWLNPARLWRSRVKHLRHIHRTGLA